jgi:hypothetical protein
MMIGKFIRQEPVHDDFLLSLSAGYVCMSDGMYTLANFQGICETFTIGQPVYDSDNNLMGYLGVGLYKNLDYAHDKDKYNGEKIPSEKWEIRNPTKYCQEGKQVFTYWQRWKETNQ